MEEKSNYQLNMMPEYRKLFQMVSEMLCNSSFEREVLWFPTRCDHGNHSGPVPKVVLLKLEFEELWNVVDCGDDHDGRERGLFVAEVPHGVGHPVETLRAHEQRHVHRDHPAERTKKQNVTRFDAFLTPSDRQI